MARVKPKVEGGHRSRTGPREVSDAGQETRTVVGAFPVLLSDC
jgi:hypothetical protein